MDALARAAALLRQLCQARGARCIVVHGAGSFGHFQAKAHGVDAGFVGDTAGTESLRKGLCLTRLSVTKLNHLVTEELVKGGVPAVGMSPFGSWMTAGRTVSRANITALRDCLRAGYIPVLHGDCVLDSEQHCTILSGDTVIEVLCQEFTPQRVVFLTDVDGIYDRPPDIPGAKLLDSIDIQPDGSLACAIQSNSLPHDTTGGIARKLGAAAAIITQSRGATTVFICRLEGPGAEGACLRGLIGLAEGTQLSLAAP
ncbi:isopentenyl phosphate kinase-like [Tachyglossus aculeatus]|uniref:isopentenyl phosphate kinase-like n=1 Tax=Tachyglossus aculeatus TaxID=9261 RepID=UPI0018F4342D|nr:isopentenyl phosphate kinase-like [Tachyglossus aculeatus]